VHAKPGVRYHSVLAKVYSKSARGWTRQLESHARGTGGASEDASSAWLITRPLLHRCPAQYWRQTSMTITREHIKRDGKRDWNLSRLRHQRRLSNDIDEEAYYRIAKPTPTCFIRRRWLSGGMRGSRRRSGREI